MTALAFAPAASIVETPSVLVLENRHTGERLEIRRVRIEGQECLELHGSLPPHREGPPMHIHMEEAEEGHVVSGILSAEVDGKRLRVFPGESAVFPRGSAHRWWTGTHGPSQVS